VFEVSQEAVHQTGNLERAFSAHGKNVLPAPSGVKRSGGSRGSGDRGVGWNVTGSAQRYARLWVGIVATTSSYELEYLFQYGVILV
jgi:hypothetical protein